MNMITQFLNSSLVHSTPILLAALGAVFCQRSGVLNIALEGMILVGALSGVLGTYFSGSVFLGSLLAMLVTMAFSALYGYFTIQFNTDPVCMGISFNLLASGLTLMVADAVFGGFTSPPQIPVCKVVRLPLLSKIPILGPVLFQNFLPVYLAMALVPLIYLLLHRSNLGLNIRSVGENPEACTNVGIKVNQVRMQAVLISGVLTGLAGAFVATAQHSSFGEEMTSGTGYIALATVVVGRANPYGIFVASLVFGASKALMTQFQTLNEYFPTQFPLMLPYMITIAALCLNSGILKAKGSKTKELEETLKCWRIP